VKRLPPILLIVLTLLCFCRLFGAEFTLLDDRYTVQKNPRLNPPSLANLFTYWPPIKGGKVNHEFGLYMPLTYTFWSGIAAAAQTHSSDPLHPNAMELNPYLFHAANVLLHMLSGLVVYAILRDLIKSEWAAFFAAAVFLFHPVQVESVAWISGAKDLLAGLFSLTAIWRYTRFAGNGGKREYGIATLAFLGALLSKPSAVTVPLIVLVLVWKDRIPPLAVSRIKNAAPPDPLEQRADTYSGEGEAPAGPLPHGSEARREPRPPTHRYVDRRTALSRKRLGLAALAPWFVLSAFFAVLGALAQPAPEVQSAPIWARPFIVGDSLTFYLWKLICPTGIGFDYGRRPAAIMQHPWFYIAWLVPMTIAIVLWKFRFRWPIVCGGALIFLLALLPNLGLVKFLFQQYSTVGNHYLYLAMFGIALIAASALQYAQHRAAWIGAGMILIVLMILSFIQTGHWLNDRTLFTHMADVNPRSYLAHCNLAIVEAQDYHDEEALRQIDLALKSEPLTPDRIDFLRMMQRDLRGATSPPAP
jgi:hypothetical protein